MNSQLPEQIKFLFLIALIVLMIFAGFIVMVVMVYKKKQLVFQKERLLQDIQHRNTILEKELEVQKKIQEERERISHDMHDDLGAGISALKLQAEFLKKKVEDNSLKTDIDDLLKTSEEMNLSMREMLWGLNPDNDNLGNFIQYVGFYADSFFKKTNTKIIIDKKVHQLDLKMNSEVRRNIFLCVKEALNNIYKHSNAENVVFKFSLKDDEFVMKIKDDGVGFSKNNTAGNGLNNMKTRMETVSGSFEVFSSDKGACLSFRIIIDRL